MGDRSILQDTVPEVEDMGALGKGRKDAPGGLFHRLATGNQYQRIEVSLNGQILG